MWILGNAGLARYKPGTALLETFTSKDGIEQSNHNQCNYYLGKNGELFIGSSRGFNHFFPDSIHVKNERLPIFITGVELADSIISMPGKERLVLRYFQNNISFSYLATDHNLAPYIRYRYKLQGFDTTFITAGKSRKARYTNLPAGKYKFIVQASPNGHDWYSAAPVKITIKQAIWKRSWFLLLMLSIVAAAVYLVFRIRVRSVRARAKQQTEYDVKMNEMENNALRTQMNPHFIFNSLNTINAFINSNDKKQANEYISKFSRLIRLILDHSRQKRVSLSEELEALSIYVQIEQIRFSNKFDYMLQIDTDIDAAEVEIPSLMIQPFVENAILHGLLPLESGGKLTMSLVKEAHILRCEITDNGIGRERAMKEKQAMPKKQKSHGLDITLKRIELFNKENGFNGGTEVIDLKDNNGNPAGTKVIIRLVYVERF
jgi:sensor histidine kinase YesM